MGLEKFQILFDNPYGVYYGGQSISGRVFIAVNSAKKVRGKLIASMRNKSAIDCYF